MSNPSLHSIQQQLITLLTTTDAFDADHPALRAIGNVIGPDVKRISLYARLAHSKRIKKIESVLTRTILCLDEPFDTLTRPFLASYPPYSATRYDNARQFFEFLIRRWGGRPETRPWLLDLARYELALAHARIQPWASPRGPDGNPGMLRRAPSVGVIRCRYDIRPLLEWDISADRPDDAVMPEKRNLFLAIVFKRGASDERVFEIGADLAGFLAGLTDWQPVGGEIGAAGKALDRLFELELVEGGQCVSA